MSQKIEEFPCRPCARELLERLPFFANSRCPFWAPLQDPQKLNSQKEHVAESHYKIEATDVEEIWVLGLSIAKITF